MAWAGTEQGRAALRSGDIETALKELGGAARGGDAEAQYLYATMLKDGMGIESPDPAAALAWYERAAKAGHPSAQLNLGYMLFRDEGASSDREAGLYWYERATGGGLAEVQYNAAKIY